MPQPVVLPAELATAVITRVRLDQFVNVHVRIVIGLADKCCRAYVTLERFGRAASVYPSVLLQIPLGAEHFAANVTLELALNVVRPHMVFNARLEVQLAADRTLNTLVLAAQVPVFFGMRQPDVSLQAVLVDEALSTKWTPFRFLVVDLLVPLEFRLRMKYIAALTHIILLLPLNVQMVFVPVLCQIRVALELLTAIGTRDRCVTRVHALMFIQFLFRHKPFAARLTLEWFDAEVPLQMDNQIGPIVKYFVALMALDRVQL